jgi:NADPH:quinone reductase-like Zn-dependent oxidoreductase
MVAEVQTPSDTTFRVFDWNRNDPARPLHIEQAMECILFGAAQRLPERPITSIARAKPLWSDGLRAATLCANAYFEIEAIEASPSGDAAPFSCTTDNAPVILMLVRGEAVMETNGHRPEHLRAGDTVLLLGTGGVSIYALQLAHAMGAEVIVTSSSDEKLARAKDLGANHVINYRQEPKWGRKVLDLTGGRGADIVVEVGGPGTLAQSIEAVRVGGHISLIGVLTGRSGEIPTGALMRKQARLHGLIVGNRTQQQDYVRALETAEIRPVIDQSFPLDGIADAFRYEESGRHFGKICLEW